MPWRQKELPLLNSVDGLNKRSEKSNLIFRGETTLGGDDERILSGKL